MTDEVRYDVVDGRGRFRCGPYSEKRFASGAAQMLAREKPLETFRVQDSRLTVRM